MDVAEGLDFLHSQAGVQHDDLKSRQASPSRLP